jgi:hypothetical protein
MPLTGEFARIDDERRLAYDGDCWHGPLREILNGVTAAMAGRGPRSWLIPSGRRSNTSRPGSKSSRCDLSKRTRADLDSFTADYIEGQHDRKDQEEAVKADLGTGSQGKVAMDEIESSLG